MINYHWYLYIKFWSKQKLMFYCDDLQSLKFNFLLLKVLHVMLYFLTFIHAKEALSHPWITNEISGG